MVVIAALLPLTGPWTHQWKLHPALLCRTTAGTRGRCRCGTAAGKRCLCRRSGPACGSISPAEGAREFEGSAQPKLSFIQFKAAEVSANMWPWSSPPLWLTMMSPFSNSAGSMVTHRRRPPVPWRSLWMRKAADDDQEQLLAWRCVFTGTTHYIPEV